jgi:UvrB/UvrC motif-containing protein
MPPRRQDIDRLLEGWPYQVGEVLARVVKAADGREVLQMRVDMGILQLEVEDRPDGTRPHGAASFFEYLQRREDDEPGFVLTTEQCMDADREFVQYYHRRICWLALREYRRAAQDADHSLAFMDFVKQHSPDEEWTMSHEQYRPFVLFHRVQAAALAELEDDGPEAAIKEINAGLARFRNLFEEYDAEERYDDDDLVGRLVELKESLREHYHVGRTLDEQLADAIAAEKYELAARLRDELSRRGDH